VPEQVAITLPVEDGLSAADYVGLAELAERCGYDAVLAGEVAGPEVFSLLGMIAARTTSIRIGSGITGMYARPPALTAMGFATLASCAPGRVIAGLGTSSPIITEGWFGTPFVNPVGTAGEFIAVLRQALTGSAVSFAGRQLRSAGFRATMSPPPRRFPANCRRRTARGCCLRLRGPVRTPSGGTGAAGGDPGS
jgi:alkanesulfonate monooxygenase SsuD/methylene tetrahydromethanopterin reductase-like flavin-dependent oxidoreductase (luciferase family)